MISTAHELIYEAFGLRIKSDLALPELPAAQQLVAADAEFRLANLSRDMPDNSTAFVDDKLFIKVRDAALYCIEGGHTVTISMLEGSSIDKVRLYLLGTCMGALLLQRGVLPLHGSSLEIDGKAYIFVGESGAGKSTLAAELLQRGGLLLSDDITAISYDDEQSPIVMPAYPQQKLWGQSLLYFGMDTAPLRMVQPGEDKYAVPISTDQAVTLDRIVPLEAVYELTKLDNAGPEPFVQNASRLESIHILLWHTYRRALISRMGQQQWHFASASSLIRRVQVSRLVRSTKHFTVKQLADAVMNDIRRNR